MPAKKSIRIMLLDDHPVILHGLETCLIGDSGIHIVGSYNTTQALLTALSQQPIDLVLLDFSLGPDEVDGLNLIRGLKIRFPTVRLLVISALHNSSTVAMAMRCGADGFIGKEVDSAQLPIAIRRVASGKTYLTDGMIEQFYENEMSTEDHNASPLTDDTNTAALLANNSSLTTREYEVLRCCLDGMSVSQIAQKFSRSSKTISTQKQSAFRKLGLRSDNELYKVRDQLEAR
ncbi:capsula synthesis response regulator transcription regulator protein [Pseudomonas chlororaphis subsp. piscium]|uniref:response regulator transcription factor n=1 Tax=Pseudomonas chlororaphis TaxID=587753 RepID=UPI000F55B112|nr:response regulator transcription factor [Pseudomonas chlororaphis]AZC51713.1 capsula synthesis response regulator transcription regulator protein [Pseudomonas chlororaphis subsp. piscium]